MSAGAKVGVPLLIVYLGAMVGCGGDTSLVSPSAPTTAVIRTDLSGHANTRDEAPVPAPEPPPANPNPVVGPPPITIGIVGSAGPGAFVPNPTQAPVGSVFVWTNTDIIRHVIALDNGTIVGDLGPGQASAPIAIDPPAIGSVGYHCTLHPSMVGSISGPAAPPSTPEPPYVPPPPIDDYYGYGY